MHLKYQEWITQHVTETYGTCYDTTLRMQAAFPELIRVRGHYYCSVWGEREHWWLTFDGEVIDPTVSQFPSGGGGVYVPWVVGDPEPTGMCPNCGDTVYDGDTCCSDSCHNSYVAYCTRAGA